MSPVATIKKGEQMFKRMAALSLVGILFVCFITGCKPKPTEPPLDPIVSSVTVPIDPSLIPIIEFAEDYIVFPTIPGVTDFVPGVVLVCPPCNQAPNGFLRKVLGVTKRDGETEVETEQAPLDEAFDQLDFEEEEELETDKIKSSRAMTDGVVFVPDAKDPAKWNYNINKNVQLFTGVNMHVEGPLSFTQSFGFSVRIVWDWGPKLDKIGFTYESDESLELDVSITGSFSIENEEAVYDTTLYEHDMSPYTFWIGAVPIVITPVISVNLSIEADGTASVSTTITQTADMEAAIRYKRNRPGSDWYTTNTQSHTFDHTPPEASMSVSAKAGAGPQLDLLLYGVAGPCISLQGYLQFEADTTEIPWWVLSLGLECEGGVNMDKISKSLSDLATLTIFDISTPIAHAPDNECSPPSFSPPGGTFNPPLAVTISCATSGATIRYTNDGSEPSATSTEYLTPLNITETATLKAKAYKSGWTASQTSNATFSITPIPLGMALVQGGTFHNGTSNVTVSGFYINLLEIKQSEYQSVMGTNPSHFSGYPNRPVETVTWFKTIEYCNRRSMQEGLAPCYSYGSYGTNPSNWPAGWNTNNANHTNVTCNWNAPGYRLPTEMEWMFAAKGGNQSLGYTYSGSNTVGNVAWYSVNSGSRTHDAGGLTANELGTKDMSGNVWEWCWDILGDYPSGDQANPTGPTSGSLRVFRGGSYYYDATRCAVSYRLNSYPASSYSDLGFRCVRIIP